MLRQDPLHKMRVAANENSIQDTSCDTALEVINYMTMINASYDTEPVAFWQQHSGHFPMHSKLAGLYLSMYSASIPVEAMFLNNWTVNGYV